MSENVERKMKKMKEREKRKPSERKEQASIRKRRIKMSKIGERKRKTRWGWGKKNLREKGTRKYKKKN